MVNWRNKQIKTIRNGLRTYNNRKYCNKKQMLAGINRNTKKLAIGSTAEFRKGARIVVNRYVAGLILAMF